MSGELFLAVAFVVLLLARVPIGFVLGLASLGYIAFFSSAPVPLEVIPQNLYASSASFVLTAIPLFILVGEIMNASGISQRLVDFASRLVGHTKGGIGIVSLMSSMMVSAFSGSAVANAAGTGAVTIPAMIRSGYSRGHASAIESASSSLGSVVPPSIAMVVWGGLTGVSIGGLFLAGYVPAVVYAIGFALIIRQQAKRFGVPVTARASLREIKMATRAAWGALVVPVIIMGGIVTGTATPTEAGALGAVYTLLLALFGYRTLRVSQLPQVLLNTAKTTGVVMLVIATASVFGWILSRERIPLRASEFALGSLENPYIILVVLVVLMTLIGTFMESLSAMAVVAPIVTSVGVAAGFDPLFIGLIAVLSLSLGVATPPVGVVLFITSRIADTSIEKTAAAVWPFLVVLVIGTIIIGFFPEIVLYLPNRFL